MVSRHYDGAVLIAPESESKYIEEYRKAFPEEQFLCFTYEEVCSLFDFAYGKAAEDYLKSEGVFFRYLPYLKKMTGGPYKHESLKSLEPLVQRLVDKGLFIRKEDPTSIFCGKTIIIRGYYSGKMIAEALQDLPNISLNWDIGMPVFGEEKNRDLRGDFAVCADFLLAKYQEICGENGDVYLRYEGQRKLPLSLAALPRLHGPFVPPGSETLYLEEEREDSLPDDLLPDAALAELHLVTATTLKQRRAFDEDHFLRHPGLCARAFALTD